MTCKLTFSIGYKVGANVRFDQRKEVVSKHYESRVFTMEEAEALAAKISATKKNFVVSLWNDEGLAANYYEGKKLHFNYSSFRMTALTKEESDRTAKDHNEACARMGLHHNTVNA